MKFEESRPIWLQVMTDLQERMISGQSPPGSKLPGGRDLALEYGINPNTAARVYQELEKTGLCETRRGMGTFVTGDGEKIRNLREESARAAAGEYREKMRKLGFSLQEAVRVLEEEE